ncbi:iron-responsive transcriptional regulator [Serratia marcescens]|nr:iron-responsive transcriptional regulator [Serratia marcescens]
MLDFRFPTALQMVLSVAVAEKQGMRSTSATLAAALEANPSFIRKLMVPLTKDGIIVSTLGRNGSIHLGRPAEEIDHLAGHLSGGDRRQAHLGFPP